MKNIGRAIRAILRNIAAAALVPVEVVIAGIRQILWRKPPLVDQALDAIEDEPPEVSAETKAARALHESRDAVRVQAAAKELMRDQTVSRRHLDPQFAGDAWKLAWLQSLSRVQLGIVAMSDLKRLDNHLNGTRALPMPLVTEFDNVVEKSEASARVQANANENGRQAAVMMQLKKQSVRRAS
ncbi:hypothetical protein [Aureimonas sp. SK2]|uniref:hypothetical protein n=1 Tax=Aureimonas sp. SK2 TaxID=3015992 RepID=UPI002444D9C8|nr:hypothetical protein [Aureimonas sp. SK2]